MPRGATPIPVLDPNQPGLTHAPLSSFVGRHDELVELQRRLADARLVTLTGPGGVGKTRLALAVSARHSGRAVVVDLAPIRERDLLVPTVLDMLGLRDRSGSDPLDRLAAALDGRELLLVLDNCEHLLAAAAATAEAVLHAAPGARVLATSRAPLRVPGEVVSPVGPLHARDAADLFVQRAKVAAPHVAVEPGLVERVCAGLDGLPLAIELAAARVRVITLDQIAAALEDRLTLLAGGPAHVDPRHRTIRACIAWSHDSLRPEEQRLFRRLSVFAGGCSLEEVAAVDDGDVLDGLAALVDNSLLLVRTWQRESRFGMLETVRDYAAEQLAASGEGELVRERHRAYFVTLAQRADDDAWAIDPVKRHRLDACSPNLRAALDDAIAARNLDALRIVAGLGYYWRETGNLREASSALTRALAATPAEPSEPRALALATVAHVAILAADVELLGSLLAEAVPMAAEIESPRVGARVQTIMLAITQVTDPRAVETLAPQAVALARSCDDVITCGYALTIAAMSASMCEEDSLLDVRLSELVEFADAHRVADARRWGYWCQARQARARGDLVQAITLADAGLALLAGERDDPLNRASLESVAATAEALAGDLVAARRRVKRGLEHSRAQGVEWGTSALLLAQSAVELAEGHPEAAWECAYLPPEKDTGSVNYEHFEAATRAALALGDGARARSEVDRIDAVAAHTGNARARALAAYGRGRVALLDDDHRGAEPLLHAALGVFDDRGWRPGVIETLEALGESAAAQGASTPAARLLSAAEGARHALRFARIPPRSEYWDGVIKPLRDTRAWAEGASLALDDAVAYARRTRGSRKRPTRGWASLTPIEAQVAELAAQGLTNPQIGERLFISRGTVKAHLRHVYEKLEISTRLELVMRRREASD